MDWKKIAADLEVDASVFKEAMITLACKLVQSEAERVKNIDSWQNEDPRKAMDKILGETKKEPETSHYRQAIKNLGMEEGLNLL